MLILSILAYTLLSGADINRTIVSGDVKLYAELEKNLDRNQPQDILELQLTLLKKLQLLAKQEKNNTAVTTPPIPQKSLTIGSSFEEYIKRGVEKERFEKRFSESERNL